MHHQLKFKTMKSQLIYILILGLLFGCNAEPRPIKFGEDICHHCKMKLMDPHFGAEVVTQKGKIFIFDDVNCLMSFLESDEVSPTDLKHILIIDYDQPEMLSDATISFFLKSAEFKTPMASNIVGFSDYETLKAYKSKHGGVYLAWGEMVTQFK
jgi:copper chaperone NosL